MKKIILLLLFLPLLAACHNLEEEFPAYEYSTVYFSYQFPERTILLGNSPMFDNSLDNAHKFKIMGTWGGGYTTKNDVLIDFKVDESLLQGLTFGDSGREVRALPSNYYTLASNQIRIPKGSVAGGVEVSLSDAFFTDPLALDRNYVIPVVMTAVQGADSILQGRADFPETANRVVAADWTVVPKDYSLWAVTFVNPWDANYLRRGKDTITEGSTNRTEVRHNPYVEEDEVIKLNTLSMSRTEFPVTYKDEDGESDLTVSLILEFNDAGNCTISSGSEGVSASGSGTFVELGDKNSWAGKDRDVLHLDYEVDLGFRQYHTLDTLVLRDRGAAASQKTFTVVLN
jgi:hypothetical protein